MCGGCGPCKNRMVTVESGTVGSVVGGRYAIEAELATGGMGVVFRVVDRPTGRVLALKRSLAGGSDSGPRNAALLEREYRTLVTLRHTACGHVGSPHLSCPGCGEPVTAREMEALPGLGAIAKTG